MQYKKYIPLITNQFLNNTSLMKWHDFGGKTKEQHPWELAIDFIDFVMFLSF